MELRKESQAVINAIRAMSDDVWQEELSAIVAALAGKTAGCLNKHQGWVDVVVSELDAISTWMEDEINEDKKWSGE